MKQSKIGIRSTCTQNDGELFAQLWLLDSQGSLYYDTNHEIKKLTTHLDNIGQSYELKYGNFRKMLTILI